MKALCSLDVCKQEVKDTAAEGWDATKSKAEVRYDWHRCLWRLIARMSQINVLIMLSLLVSAG